MATLATRTFTSAESGRRQAIHTVNFTCAAPSNLRGRVNSGLGKHVERPS
jgi:hypothetical protein